MNEKNRIGVQRHQPRHLTVFLQTPVTLFLYQRLSPYSSSLRSTIMQGGN